jgi:hypothetical protein
MYLLVELGRSGQEYQSSNAGAYRGQFGYRHMAVKMTDDGEGLYG